MCQLEEATNVKMNTRYLPDFINFVMDPNLTPEDEPKISEQADKIDKNYEVQMNNVETVQKALAKKFTFIII